MNELQSDLIKEAMEKISQLRSNLGDPVTELILTNLQKELNNLTSFTNEERKLVTILFSDLSGFTSMSENLDPEEVREIMKMYFDAVTQPILEYGGVIEKFIGYAIMAVFGLPQVQETDAENAVRAALKMYAKLQELNEQLSVQWGFSLNMRIGINTGFVLTRFAEGDQNQDFRVFGDTVNTASRLESSAPIGGILISHNTYIHVNRIFDLLPQTPLKVKGKAETIQTYLVKGIRQRHLRAETTIRGIATPMIGRDKEFSQLQTNWFSSVQSKQTNLLTIVGDAGMGKSRLLYEFRNWLKLNSPSYTLWQVRANQRFQSQPHALLRLLFADTFKILETDPLPIVWQKMEDEIKKIDHDLEQSVMHSHIIGQFLGFNFDSSPHIQGIRKDSQQIHTRAITYIGRLWEQLAEKQPFLLILEDTHWADESSLIIIKQLSESLADKSGLIICLTRPSLFDLIPNWLNNQTHHEAIALRPLSLQNSRRLIQALLKNVVDLPASLQKLIVNRAEGNPFYVEELIKMLLEDGVIIQNDTDWRVNLSKLEKIRIPSTLAGILQARLDSLPAIYRRLLQQASVIGRIFWDDALSSIQKQEISAEKQTEQLTFLQERELIFKHDASAFAEVNEYIFKHNLLRDVAYESVLKRDRKEYHAQVAQWLIKQTGERTQEYASSIASHLEKASQNQEAISYLIQASSYASNTLAYQESMNFLHRAHELLTDEDKDQRMIITRMLGKTLSEQGELDAAEKQFVISLDLAEQLGKELNLAILLRHYGNLLRRKGNLIQANEMLDKSLSIVENLNDSLGIAEANKDLGWISISMGKNDQAKEYFATALTQFKQLSIPNNAGEIQTLTGLGALAHMTGRYEEAKKYHSQTLSSYARVENRFGVAIALSHLGEVARLQNDFAKAEQNYQTALDIVKEIGNQLAVCTLLDNLGHTQSGLNQNEVAIKNFRESIELALKIGAHPVALDAMAGLALPLMRTGKTDLGLILINFAENHPASDDEVKQTLDSIRSNIPTPFPTNNTLPKITEFAQIMELLQQLD